ncbi:MAG: hypothetical protein WCE64_13365 [Bacteroidales bacterium]
MDQISSHPLYRKHNIDSAMTALWEFYKLKFFPLFIASFIMSLIMQYASTLINFKELYSITDPQALILKMKDYIWPMITVSVINLFFITILHYYVIYNPVSSGNNLFRCALKSMRYFIPYLIIMVLLTFFASFALFIGFLALVIGALFAAIYVMVIFLFILPVMLVEGPNIGSTITRTISLAHRNFWSNMGWTAVFVVILIVLSLILSGIVLLPFTGSFLKSIVNPSDAGALAEAATNPVYIVLNALVGAVILPLMPIFASILYFNGRAREEVQSAGKPPENDYQGRVKVEDLYAGPRQDDDSEKAIDQ